MRVHIELTNSEGWMPMFVIGYEREQEGGRPLGDLALPPWVFIMEHQGGGYSCWHPVAMGAVLRLEANRSHAIRDLQPLLRAFRAMAEDPDRELLRTEFPMLSPLVYTRGELYGPSDLRVLEQFISSFVAIPPLQRGIEAFLEHQACDPCDYFAGWHMLSVMLKDPAQRVGNLWPLGHEDWDPDRDYCIWGWRSDFFISEDTLFNRMHLDALTAVGKQIGHSEPPKVFFLWENSD